MLSASLGSLGFIKPDLEHMKNNPDNSNWVYRDYTLVEDSVQGMVGEFEDTVQNPVNGVGQVYKGHRIKPFTGEFTLSVTPGPAKTGEASLRNSFLRLYNEVQPGKTFIFNVHNAPFVTSYGQGQDKFYNATYSARLRTTRSLAWPNPDPQDFDQDNIKVIVPVICDNGFWFQAKSVYSKLENGVQVASLQRKSNIPSGFKVTLRFKRNETTSLKGVWRGTGLDFLNLNLEAGDFEGLAYINFDLGEAPVVRRASDSKVVKSLTGQLKPQDYTHLQSPAGDVVRFTSNFDYRIDYEERHLVPWGGDES